MAMLKMIMYEIFKFRIAVYAFISTASGRTPHRVTCVFSDVFVDPRDDGCLCIAYT